jgi:heme-degrading monooxygenase HmoA
VSVRIGVAMIARTWRGWVRTEQAVAYVEYITRTGLSEYEKTPGNLGAQMWTADLGDGRTEVMTVSWWSSRTDIEGFAGQDIDVAVFYPEDDAYLIERETTVMHYEVARTL